MESTDAKTVGLFVKKYRLKASLTQFDLAELVGIDEKHLSRIENGKSFPSLITLNSMLIALDLTFALVGLGGESFKYEGNSTYIKAIQILNSAESETQLECYLETLKNTQNLFKLFSR